jgi:hypothetical protein
MRIADIAAHFESLADGFNIADGALLYGRQMS